MTAFQQNLHRVFRATEEGYVQQIKPTQDQRNLLDQCRADIRACLKPVLTEYCRVKTGHGVTPLFRVQGSWAYGTCNQPAHPNQEMDLDYGVYLPCSVYGDQRSDKGAIEFFEVVERALTVLAQQKGWDIKEKKATCVRLNIPTPAGTANAHLDVPMYVVPDDMFSSFEENETLYVGVEGYRVAKANRAFDSASIRFGDGQINESSLIKLGNIKTIHMAKRDGGWKDSDCEKVRRWFLDEQESYIEDKGRQLRYVVRYLKAWRDQHWKDGGPTSILLMVIASQHYQYHEGRDDKALHAVTAKLPQALLGSVREPNIEGHADEDFNGKYDVVEKQAHHQLATKFHEKVTDALATTRPFLSLTYLKEQLGARISSDTSLITSDLAASSASSPVNRVMSQAPTVSVAPAVLRSQQGG